MRLSLTLLFLALVGVCFSQSRFPGHVVTTPPKIDGQVTDEEWSAVPKATGGYDEQTGTAEPNPSTYWLAYDAQFIYIAAKIAESDPKSIKATETRTNVSLSGDDYIIFDVDPFSTLSDTSQFEVNANGATNLRIAGGRAAKREWLGDIQAAGRITATGYEIEARIPWSIMRLPSAGVRDLRVTFGHIVSRTSRAFILDNTSGNKSQNVGYWQAVSVPKVSNNRSLKLLPYGYFGGDRDGIIANAGIDYKMPVTDQLDLVGSINPDFRNIENQVLSIDFSYFERLAGESRPFFLEGNQYFQTSQDAPLFVSQRIDGFDIGTKIYGKIGAQGTLGFLNTVDFGNEMNTVGSFNYNFDPHTAAHVAIANHESPVNSNLGSFVSFSHDFGPLSVFAQHMSTTDTQDGIGHRINSGFVYSGQGLTGVLEYTEISPKFRPRLGFAPERDFRGGNFFIEYVKPVKLGPISELGVNASYFDSKTFENTPYRKTIDIGTSTTTKDGYDFDFDFNYQEFQGFKDSLFFFSLEHPRGDPYRHWQLDYATGNIAGHSYRSIGPSLTYRPIKPLQLAISYQRVDHFETSDQLILSGNYELSKFDAISGRAIQRDSDTNFYLAFRRAGNRGNEYFLILGDPNARSFRTSLILKAVFPLEIRF